MRHRKGCPAPLHTCCDAPRAARCGYPLLQADAPEIPLDKQRPAEFVFSRHVEHKVAEIREREAQAKRAPAAE